jgi:hypothetical protein
MLVSGRASGCKNFAPHKTNTLVKLRLGTVNVGKMNERDYEVAELTCRRNLDF